MSRRVEVLEKKLKYALARIDELDRGTTAERSKVVTIFNFYRKSPTETPSELVGRCKSLFSRVGMADVADAVKGAERVTMDTRVYPSQFATIEFESEEMAMKAIANKGSLTVRGGDDQATRAMLIQLRKLVQDGKDIDLALYSKKTSQRPLEVEIDMP